MSQAEVHTCVNKGGSKRSNTRHVSQDTLLEASLLDNYTNAITTAGCYSHHLFVKGQGDERKNNKITVFSRVIILLLPLNHCLTTSHENILLNPK